MTDTLDPWERRLIRLMLAEARRINTARTTTPPAEPPTDQTTTQENR